MTDLDLPVPGTGLTASVALSPSALVLDLRLLVDRIRDTGSSGIGCKRGLDDDLPRRGVSDLVG